MAYPSLVSLFTNPSANQRLNSPSHSSIESMQNTDLTAIETFVGTEASTVGTLFYDIRSSNSNGGGHIQSANKGGTGQTAYTKGDILVATSASVLAKLAIGIDGTVPTANSGALAGISWSPVVANITYSEDSGTGSVYAIYPTACVLSLAAGQTYLYRAANNNTVTTPALSVSSLIARPIKNADGSSVLSGTITASTLTLVGYEGNQSYFGILGGTGAGVVYKNGATTKDASDASTTQNIAHGLGKIPKFVKITAQTFNNAGSSPPGHYSAFTVYNGTTQSSTAVYAQNGSNATSNALFALNSNTNTTGNNTGVVTFDTTNIIITWTKSGGPTGSYNLVWEACA